MQLQSGHSADKPKVPEAQADVIFNERESTVLAAMKVVDPNVMDKSIERDQLDDGLFAAWFKPANITMKDPKDPHDIFRNRLLKPMFCERKLGKEVAALKTHSSRAPVMEEDILRFCYRSALLEDCYCFLLKPFRFAVYTATKLYLALEKVGQFPNPAECRVMEKIFRDMLRSEHPYYQCMHRVYKMRFNRTLTDEVLTSLEENLKEFEQVLGQQGIRAPTRLCNRAFHFYTVISRNQLINKDPKGTTFKRTVPLEACLTTKYGLMSSDGSRITSPVSISSSTSSAQKSSSQPIPVLANKRLEKAAEKEEI